MSRRLITCALGAVALLLSTGCAQDEALRRVENELGDLKVQVNRLKLEVEEANRRGDQDRSAASEARAQDRRFQADLQETLRQLKDATRVVSSRIQDQPARRGGAPAQQPAQAPQGEDQTLQSLLLDYNKGNYPLAAESLETFLKGRPPVGQKADALFFLGFCYWHMKQFDKALVAFDRITKEHGDSERLVTALLKKAQCQVKLNLKAAAREGFKALIDKFPGTPEARNAQEELADLEG